MASVIIGVSISPSRRYAAALRLVPSAHYLADELYEREREGWTSYGGGSGGGISWTNIVDRPTGAASDENLGVLRYGDEAPPGAAAVRIGFKGNEDAVPVVHGHFLFVAWDTPLDGKPLILGFVTS